MPVPWRYLMESPNEEEVIETFYEKKLQKTYQKNLG